MTLTPFLDAPLMIQLHVVAALGAITLGPLAMLRRSRDRWHKVLGRAWVGAMATVALSSFLINEGQMFGPFSVIHLLSVLTLWGLWQAVAAARAGRIAEHRAGMLALYVWALGVAGLFTLLPGRRMNLMLFPEAPLAGFLGAAAAFVLAGAVLWGMPGLRKRSTGGGTERGTEGA
jgi:uncharacterized membrane protein